MEFVQQRHHQYERRRTQFGADRIGLFVFETAVCKHCEDEVPADVRAFSYHTVPQVKLARRESGKEELQYRSDYARSLARGKRVRRQQEDKEEPDKERRPVFQNERLHYLVWGTLPYSLIETTTLSSKLTNRVRFPGP